MTSEAFCAAIDWGSTNLRIRLLDRQGNVINTFTSSEGLINLPDRDFNGTLEGRLAELGADAELPVVICGMAGSRQGWLEVPYLQIPAGLGEIPKASLKVEKASRPVHILPGLSQIAPSADVMRGEETQLLGLTLEREIDGIVCMPGTHSKWVLMKAGGIERFSTFMTGEVYALLVKHSLLRFSVDEATDALWERPAFSEAVQEVMEHPERFGAALFGIRADGLLKDVGQADATARLSGLCVGMELAGAGDYLKESGTVEVVASGVHAELYRKAFELLGFPHNITDASEASRKGLYSAARQIYGR